MDEPSVERLAVHRVGNLSRGERLQLSDRATEVDEAVSDLILAGYLKGIVSDQRKYQFFHESDLNQNELYHFTRQFFRGELDFLAVSQRIARHLQAHSQHPNIREGDLLVILFNGLPYGEDTQRGLGVFKSEVRDDFLTVIESANVFDVSHASGINPRLIDKGALILENGPTVYAVDRLGNQTKFWLDDFLKALRVPDTGSSSKMMVEVLDQLSDDIDDPSAQARFKDEVLTLCREETDVSPRQVAAMAEKFVPREHVSQALDNAAESYGFALDHDAGLPAQRVFKRLERTWSKVGVGHGISVLLPSELSLQGVRSSDDDEGELTLTLTLLRRPPNE